MRSFINRVAYTHVSKLREASFASLSFFLSSLLYDCLRPYCTPSTCICHHVSLRQPGFASLSPNALRSSYEANAFRFFHDILIPSYAPLTWSLSIQHAIWKPPTDSCQLERTTTTSLCPNQGALSQPCHSCDFCRPEYISTWRPTLKKRQGET